MAATALNTANQTEPPAERPDTVHGRLMESVHLSGYSFERACNELEWLLDEDRWRKVGGGFKDIKAFLATLDLSSFRLVAEQRQKIAARLAELEAPQRATAELLGISQRQVGRDLEANASSKDDLPKEETAPPEANASKPQFVTLDEWGKLDPSEAGWFLRARETKTKLNRQDNDAIEWAQWSWNPVTGCLHNCPYCYARDIAERFYSHGFEPTFHHERLGAPAATVVPREAETDTRFRNVFTCSMADLFGRWVPREWIEAVLGTIADNPQWNFLCLTKFPKRMAEFEIPANAWMGTTVDLQARIPNAETAFAKVKSGIRWLSVEPMLEPLKFKRLDLFQWIVIGGASKSSQTPEWRPPLPWINDLVAQADAAGVRVYFKTNLLGNRRLELPFDAPIKADPTAAPEVFNYLGQQKAAA